jgi:hypothetical protein
MALGAVIQEWTSHSGDVTYRPLQYYINNVKKRLFRGLLEVLYVMSPFNLNPPLLKSIYWKWTYYSKKSFALQRLGPRCYFQRKQYIAIMFCSLLSIFSPFGWEYSLFLTSVFEILIWSCCFWQEPGWKFIKWSYCKNNYFLFYLI